MMRVIFSGVVVVVVVVLQCSTLAIVNPLIESLTGHLRVVASDIKLTIAAVGEAVLAAADYWSVANFPLQQNLLSDAHIHPPQSID